jgi:hypothetical protein
VHVVRQLNKKKMETAWSVRFFAVSADEVTTIDNGTWISITLYYISEFARRSFMVTLEHVEEGASSNNLTRVIIKAVTSLTGMSRSDIASRMVAFGAGL